MVIDLDQMRCLSVAIRHDRERRLVAGSSHTDPEPPRTAPSRARGKQRSARAALIS